MQVGKLKVAKGSRPVLRGAVFKAFGADGLPKEAFEESPGALDDFLEIVEASIFQEQVCDWMIDASRSPTLLSLYR